MQSNKDVVGVVPVDADDRPDDVVGLIASIELIAHHAYHVLCHPCLAFNTK